MLQEEILFLLKNNDRVIIPEIGAIMVKPGTGTLTFNEFLKYNDGVLADHLSKTKEFDKQEANKEIKKFTNNIIRSLFNEKKYDLGPIGTLYIDENEKIQIKTAIVLSPDSIKTNHNVIKEPINETLKEQQPYITPETSSLQKESDSKTSISATLKQTSMSVTNSKITENQTYQSDEFSRYERHSRGKTIMIVLSIVVILLVVAYFLFFKNQGILFGNKQIANTADTNVVAVPKTIGDPKQESVSQGKQESAVSNQKNKYHIIAGAFVVDKNANAFMQDLKNKGYDSKVVLKRNEYNFVSIFSFTTFREANDKFKTLENTGMPIWIMKYQER